MSQNRLNDFIEEADTDSKRKIRLFDFFVVSLNCFKGDDMILLKIQLDVPLF